MMIIKLSIALSTLTLAAASFAAGTEAQTTQDTPPQATIHFANDRGIQDWRADGETGLFIRDRQNHWYHATLMSPCIGLPFVNNTIGFETEVNGDFDNFSFITVGRERCQVVSLVKSDPPPDAHK